jgi:hypothetical protein
MNSVKLNLVDNEVNTRIKGVNPVANATQWRTNFSHWTSFNMDQKDFIGFQILTAGIRQSQQTVQERYKSFQITYTLTANVCESFLAILF